MKIPWNKEYKTKEEKKKLYLSLLPTIRKVARKSGYAIGVHGSMTRDFDLIAVPWVKKTVSPETLALRINEATCKYPYTRKGLRTQPQNKPHGRITYALHLNMSDVYIDLSITPTH